MTDASISSLYSNMATFQSVPNRYSETLTYNRNSAITSLTRTGNSLAMGPFYVPLVAVPSFTSAVIAKDGNHRYSSYERDANYRAFMYFNKYVEGFYINEKSYYAWDRDKSKGWHLAENPLLPREYNKRYIDYLNPEDINRIKNI